jgi:hypothetical protein
MIMAAESEVLNLLRSTHGGALSGKLQKEQPVEKEATEEDSCSAFGYLRGLHDRALAVEFRLRDGNSEWYSYSLLASWQHNPSVGVMLKFTGDVVTLVLIRGSNLDALVNQSVNLTDRGIQRHRISFIREMDEAELRKTGEEGPTIDRIEIAEFDSQEELREWLKKNAPAFQRKG